MERPTYFTMMTLFEHDTKYYNQSNRILHHVSHMALQASLLIGTMEPSKFVPGSCDRQACATSNSGQLRNNLKLGQKFSARYAL